MTQPPNFDCLAKPYRWMELFSFGPMLSLTRATFLNRLEGCRFALVIGDGDGRFTARLLTGNSFVRIDAVDASSAMLRALLRNAGSNADRVHTHQADARNWQPPPLTSPYDLIATHFFLDCLTQTEVEALAVKLRAIAAPGALWVVSEFAIPSNLFGRLIARPLVFWLYTCFGLLTGLAVRSLPNHAAALQSAGFHLVERRTRLGGLLIAELWAASSPSAGATCRPQPL
jgi:hypothetical protein